MKNAIVLLALTSLLTLLSHQLYPQQRVILSEDFEDNQLDSLITIETIGAFNSPSGIKGRTEFGSEKAFGFGLSNCGANCFDNYITKMKITLPEPTYVSSISFKEMELFDNWGSDGALFIDGVPFTDGFRNFGRLPYNDRISDTSFRSQEFHIDTTATLIEIWVRDITNRSEIFIDDLLISSSQVTSIDSGLVGFWPFNGNADDESGNGNHGQVIGATLTSGQTETDSSVYYFDGINDYIEINNNLTGNLGDSASITFWFHTTDETFQARDQRLVEKDNGSWWVFFITQSDNFVFSVSENNRDSFGDVVLTKEQMINRWHFIAAVKTNNEYKVFADDSLALQFYTPFNHINTIATMTFGRSEFWTSQHFKGKLDDIRLYNRALTPEELDILADFPTSVAAIDLVAPDNFRLFQNYPNPFNPETTIRYQLIRASQVKLSIYNLLGQSVVTLVNEPLLAGEYQTVWNGKDSYGLSVASGVYLIQMSAANFVQTRKVLLIR